MLVFLLFLPTFLLPYVSVSAAAPGPIGSNNARVVPVGEPDRPVWGARARSSLSGSLLKSRIVPDSLAAHARTVYARASTTPPSGWSYVDFCQNLIQTQHTDKYLAIRSQLGCYNDATSSRALGAYSSSTSSNTITTCLNTCHLLGYAYGGVEYGMYPVLKPIVATPLVSKLLTCSEKFSVTVS